MFNKRGVKSDPEKIQEIKKPSKVFWDWPTTWKELTWL